MRALRGALLGLVAFAATAAAGGDGASEATLRDHVAYLAGPDLHGRGSPEDRGVVAAWVAKELADLGLGPVPGAASRLLDQGSAEAKTAVRNVVAWLPGASAGTTKEKAGEWVLLGAHYDHLGVRDGKTYFGADDNASGVAALLEAARLLAARAKEKPLRRSLMVVAFDREEQGLVGSRMFCETPPLPLADCAAAVVMDQLGRSALDMHAGTLLVQGAESSAAVEAAVAAAGAPEGGRIASLGIDFNPGTSDYEPFRDRQHPFVFLTSGPHEDYHRPTDLPDRLDYGALTARTDWVVRLAAAVADGKDRPSWRERPAPRVEEVKTVRDLVAPIVPQAAELGLPPFLQMALKNFHAHLQKLVDGGTITPEQRSAVVNTTKMLLNQAQLVQR